MLFIFLLIFNECDAQYVTPQYAEIRAVSAMCSSDGITASIDFDKPFTGKVYSLNYETVNDCLYYNNIDRDTVLFSIPAHICGTKLQRSSRNMIDQMENRVYVQMDKDTQTSADKQFSFVCKLSDPQKTIAAPAKDDATSTKDSYLPLPIKPVASSMTTKMSNSVQPIKPSEVRQVAAFSRDMHLGNWPIPGSKPYEPSMKPISTYPMAPQVPAVPALDKPTYTSVQESAYARPISSVGHNEVSQPLFPPPPTPSPLFPNLPTFPPVQRAPPVAAKTFTTMPPPIVPNVHFKQGVGVPFVQKAMNPTKVDAEKWNEASAAYVTPPGSSRASAFEETTLKNSIQIDATTPPKPHNHTHLTADAPFSGDNLINTEVLDTTKKPATTSVLKTTQQQIEPEVTLEIQKGEGPFAPPVTSPIKIGDNISLVVKAQSYLNESEQFDMFVHSCFATDGKGSTKIQIIDENGCVIRREFASPLNRAKDSQHIMYYYVMIKAFKFPGPDDVYFSCSIEFTPLTVAPKICSKLRRRREIDKLKNAVEMRLFDNVNVELEDEEPQVSESTTLKTECESLQQLYQLCIALTFIILSISLILNFFQFFRKRKF
ncbi:unnamed protein product [Caenorhabditis bovis]|uniref:ZP domain-containing protein n=1 Tax=Caenorhabditis bovis TaxID=2654633 RepID=A0A8S1FAA4_9PELO|nr:unnamed protein product [Caenorhabditis bovis]